MNFPAPVTQPPLSNSVSFLSGEYTLVGTLFTPPQPPRAVVVLNGATGVPAQYYSAFAQWLVETRQIACLTYDYRTFGASQTESLRRSQATMTDWGVHDQNAARAFASAQFPGAPVWVIGHSLGALCLAFQSNLDQIERIVSVASGPVHTRDHPWPYQGLARLFWFGHVPALVAAAGFLPGKKLGLGENLPAGVYWQWRRWCTRRDFFARDIGTALPFPDWTAINADMRVVAIADDVMVPPKAVWRLMQFYPNARKVQHTLRPADHGLDRIGHVGVFAERNRAAWPALLD